MTVGKLKQAYILQINWSILIFNWFSQILKFCTSTNTVTFSVKFPLSCMTDDSTQSTMSDVSNIYHQLYLSKRFCQFCQISCLKNIMQFVIKIVLKYLAFINGTFWFVMIFRHLFGAWESIYIVFLKLLLFKSLFVKKKIGNGKFMILKCTSNVDTEKVHYWQRYPMIRNTPLLHFVQVFVHFLTNITSPSVFIFCN